MMRTLLASITDLTGLEELRPGGHNFPDMQIVIDPAQTEIVDNQIYMIQNIYKHHITVHGRVVGVWAGGLGS